MGYSTCYYRTFNVGRATDSQTDAYKKARDWMHFALALVHPGIGTDQIAKVFPKAEEFEFFSEMEAFALQFCHGLGVALHERPIVSRLVSLEKPQEIKEGMVFPLETYCPASDGFSAARIEEQVVVTNDGCWVITLVPAGELPIASPYQGQSVVRGAAYFGGAVEARTINSGSSVMMVLVPDSGSANWASSNCAA